MNDQRMRAVPAAVFCALLLPSLMSGGDAAAHPEGTRGSAMALVPAGEFKMGCNRGRDGHCDADESPYHTVFLDAYYIDLTEVTVGQYQECAQAGACRRARDYADFDHADQPAVGVSWDDASRYCKWAGKRLPSEAEWEKAARGTDGRVFPWGNAACGCACAIQEQRQVYGCGHDATWPVGSAPKGASPYGALDMSGNVWEWVADWYAADYYKNSPREDPKGPESGEKKVRRGGCFANIKNYLRASDRNFAPPETLSNSLGFRCAVTAK
jgi:formylglycine-generating enzyme required for sulfatase activity